VTETFPARNAGPVRPNYRHYGLKVSRYDRVAGMLLALLILIGSTVLVLLIIWLTSRIFASQVAVPVILEEIGEGGGMLGDSMEMEAPDMEETDLEQPALTDTLSAVTDAVAATAAMLADPAIYAEINQKGGGRGDGRLAGSGSGRPGRPRHWEVRFPEGQTLESYARQLDYFGIELGVLMPGNKVEYASQLSNPTPKRRTGPADQEKRYYLTWRKGELQQADRELLRRAGIDATGRLILKFLPPKLEMQLVQMERTRAGPEADHIRATYFVVSPKGGGYEFRITDQSYR